jgi:DNA repair photolyase
MRWQEQRVETERAKRLPGVGDAVVRTFDAPEALGIRFHEVRAKSALNHVPGMPYGFEWTVNVYRGCTHACVYCLAGDTAVLMADGQTKLLADVQVGDRVYGTRRGGSYRRLAITRVLAHWATVKPGYRVTLSDGTLLVASGDHRLLSDRGWRYVSGLTPGVKLMGAPARPVEGGSIRPASRLTVSSVERADEDLKMFDITTGTGDFVANGVVSHNCFARPTHTYLDFNSREDFEREIVVKVNAPEVLRAELGRRSWQRDLVALGTNTDPYQWVESRYRLTRGVLEALRDHDTPVSVLTKSPLAMRDLDLFMDMAERVDVSVNFSVPTVDQRAWRATEPHTPSPRARLEAVAELRRHGIRSGIMVAPLMPGINDAPEQLEPILEAAKEADATFVGSAALHLRGELRDVFFGWLRAKRPDLVPRYEELYARGGYMPPPERARLTALVGSGRESARRERMRARPRRTQPEPAQGDAPEREQGRLF